MAATAPIDAAPNKKVYVGNLPFSTTEDQLRQHFAQYGDLQEVVVLMRRHVRRDRESGEREVTRRSMGAGFVEFAALPAAEKAVKAAKAKPVEWEGRAITVAYAKPKEDKVAAQSAAAAKSAKSAKPKPANRQQRSFDPEGATEIPTKILVSNLAYGTDNAALLAFFKSLGVKVKQADVQMRQRRARDDTTEQPTMVSRGYGIVEFATAGDRAKALEAAAGKELAERKLRVKPYFEKPAAIVQH